MADIKDLKALQEQIQSALISTTRTSSQIAAQDLPFLRSLDRSLGDALDEQSSRLLELSGALLKSAASLADLNVPVLEDRDDVENNWRGVVDIVDSLLEKTDTSLDEYTGVRKLKETPLVEQAAQKCKPSKSPYPIANAYRTQNLLKPQLAFEVKPDNQDVSPWKPLLISKPHAIQSLEESLGTFINEFDQNQYRHPYETEILHLSYPDAVYQKADPIPYQPIETTSAVFVDTLEGVMEMLEELKTATEIAVDLEHHDQRSYVGLVSLMQVSTREKDWIVDTLKPWRQKLQVLNEVFTDPKILKVFHGAYMDIMWLQRDLGLYVVGLFDTYHASRSLGYAGGSLAFLLKKFINFDADKKYQMSDWRIRPLLEEMFFYARSDTHFLLYIYDCMRNELIDRPNPDVPDENRIEIVLQSSKEVSLIRFERQVYNIESGKGPGGWYNLVMKTSALFNNEQFAVFRAVHGWRDKVARLDDDSISFVMPNNAVISLAKLMPMDMVALLSIIHPISHNVKSRMGELLDLIKSAKAQGKTGPSMMDVLRPNTIGAIAKANLPSLAAKSIPKTLLAIEEETELRSDQSAFWGGAFGSSIWDTPTPKEPSKVLFALPTPPLPQITSEYFESASPALVDRSRAPLSSPVQPSTPVKKEDQAFVIKRGAKRKSSELSAAEDAFGDNEISLNDPEDEKKKVKAARRAEKRAKKGQNKVEEAKAGGDVEGEVAGEIEGEEDVEMVNDDEPFDYSKAQSVLHSKRSGGEQGGRDKKKPFDPYVKSADAPKGMRRLQTERPGKSRTFKS